MEDAARAPHADRAALQRLAHWLTVGDPDLRRLVPEALDTVERVRASGFWQRAMMARIRSARLSLRIRVH